MLFMTHNLSGKEKEELMIEIIKTLNEDFNDENWDLT